MLRPAPSPSSNPVPVASFEGAIEGFTRDGYIYGWARQLHDPEPVMVRLLLHREEMEPEILGEGVARYYRASLLAAGKNLGHCAFFIRPRYPLSPGEHRFSLLALPGEEEIVPSATLQWPENLEEDASLIARDERASWTDEDVLAHLDRFELARQCATLGAERFVDISYRFILGRWMDDSARGSYVIPLEQGRLTPEEVFRILIMSQERRDKTTPLPSPYDYRFPFHPPYRLGR